MEDYGSPDPEEIFTDPQHWLLQSSAVVVVVVGGVGWGVGFRYFTSKLNCMYTDQILAPISYRLLSLCSLEGMRPSVHTIQSSSLSRCLVWWGRGSVNRYNGEEWPDFPQVSSPVARPTFYCINPHSWYWCTKVTAVHIFKVKIKKRLRDKMFAKSVPTRWRRKEDIAEAFTTAPASQRSFGLLSPLLCMRGLESWRGVWMFTEQWAHCLCYLLRHLRTAQKDKIRYLFMRCKLQ